MQWNFITNPYYLGTMGGGGHSEAIVKQLTTGRLLSIDQDPDAMRAAGERLGKYPQSVRVRGNFAQMGELARAQGMDAVDGVLLDIGVSSYQLDTPERGFSYHHDAPLDMRMSQEGPTARDLVNTLSQQELADIIFRYGEDKSARRIAQGIVQAREELRIAVNGELDRLREGLEAGFALLKPGGRLAVITFHSLEDRIVKQQMHDWCQGCVCPKDFPVCVCGRKPQGRLVYKKGLAPSAQEVAENPRARSARLRVIEKLPQEQ